MQRRSNLPISQTEIWCIFQEIEFGHTVDDLSVIYSFYFLIWARCKQSVGDLWLSSKASLAVVASSKAINAMYQIYKKGNDQNLTFLALMS